MSSVLVLVEGQTEQAFVQRVLAPSLDNRGVYVSASLLGKPGSKSGGVRSWARTKRDILAALKESSARLVSTMFDYFQLPQDWPGKQAAKTAPHPKALVIEQAIHAEVVAAMGEGFNSARFIPYVEMHEFEAMLFSDCDALAGAIQKPSLAASFQSILAEFGCPEAINDGIETAPSKRILQLAPEFDKLLHGSIAATRTGLDKIRAACPHFNQWLDKLESLGSAQEAQPT